MNSQPTHTPGPWKLATAYAKAQRNIFDIVPWANQSHRICRMQEREDYSIAQVMGDAQLIAAAPELLEALKGILGICHASMTGFAPDIAKLCETAIQKAEGRR